MSPFQNTESLERSAINLKIYRDLIDTEHANGDIYKMLLGSLCSDIDAQESVVIVPHKSPNRSMQNSNETFAASSTASCTMQDQISLSPAEVSFFGTPSTTSTRLSSQTAKSAINKHASMLFTSSYTRHELPADLEFDEQDIRRLASVRRSNKQQAMNSSPRYSPLYPDSTIHDGSILSRKVPL